MTCSKCGLWKDQAKALGAVQCRMGGEHDWTCSFCHGEPVLDAASWLDDKPRQPAACPRCGEVNYKPGDPEGTAYPNPLP